VSASALASAKAGANASVSDVGSVRENLMVRMSVLISVMSVCRLTRQNVSQNAHFCQSRTRNAAKFQGAKSATGAIEVRLKCD